MNRGIFSPRKNVIMKNIYRLLSSLIVFCTMSAHAQNENVVFPYSHASLIDLIKDTTWQKESAEKYLLMVMQATIPPSIIDQIYACVISNENEEGMKLLLGELMKIGKFETGFSF